MLSVLLQVHNVWLVVLIQILAWLAVFECSCKASPLTLIHSRELDIIMIIHILYYLYDVKVKINAWHGCTNRNMNDMYHYSVSFLSVADHGTGGYCSGSFREHLLPNFCPWKPSHQPSEEEMVQMVHETSVLRGKLSPSLYYNWRSTVHDPRPLNSQRETRGFSSDLTVSGRRPHFSRSTVLDRNRLT